MKPTTTTNSTKNSDVALGMIEGNANSMNDLPVIGYPCFRKELWDRQGANSASRKKFMAKSCFDVHKNHLWSDQRFFTVVLKQRNLDSV